MIFTINNKTTADLGGQQSKILKHLMNHYKRIVSLDELVELLTSERANPVRADIQNQVSRLRRNLRDIIDEDKSIVTVPYAGYQWKQGEQHEQTR